MDGQADTAMLEMALVGSYSEDLRECDIARPSASDAHGYNSESLGGGVSSQNSKPSGELRIIVHGSTRNAVESWLGRCVGPIS